MGEINHEIWAMQVAGQQLRIFRAHLWSQHPVDGLKLPWKLKWEVQNLAMPQRNGELEQRIGSCPQPHLHQNREQQVVVPPSTFVGCECCK